MNLSRPRCCHCGSPAEGYQEQVTAFVAVSHASETQIVGGHRGPR